MKSSGNGFFVNTALMVLVIGNLMIAMVSAGSSPNMPHSFYGTLTLDGSPSPVGTNVVAKVGGVDRTLAGPYYTTVLGEYGSGFTKLSVNCTTGEIITFWVNSQQASQQATCLTGSVTMLNLTAGQGAPQCTDNDGDGYGNPANAVCAHPELDCNDNNALVHPGAAEKCNGIDDNCNGQVDETFTDLGDTCYAGVGECQRAGTKTCTGDGLGTQCNAVAGQPEIEICDGLDNDCDGATDEGGVCMQCQPGQTENQQCGTTDVGACEYGTETRTCDQQGVWGAWEGCDAIEPTTEVCNGIDDNCNGATDETFAGLGDTCYAGVGVCQNAGTTVCSQDGLGTQCNAVAGQPAIELCDGLDNDCDGSVDEAFINLGNSCYTGVGACQSSGYYICAQDGLGTQCNAVAGQPTAEVCGNTIDDDCDGLTDMADPDCQIPVEYCIQINNVRVLDTNFNEVTEVTPGTLYNIEVTNENTCDYDITPMQIIQVMKTGVFVNIGTMKSTIHAYDTSVITAGFVLNQNAVSGTVFDVSVFNWNHWITQDPGTWEALSEPSSTQFEAA